MALPGGLAGHFVLSRTASGLDEFLVAGGLANGRFVCLTTAEHPPHDFVWVESVFPPGHFSLQNGLTVARRPAPFPPVEHTLVSVDAQGIL